MRVLSSRILKHTSGNNSTQSNENLNIQLELGSLLFEWYICFMVFYACQQIQRYLQAQNVNLHLI